MTITDRTESRDVVASKNENQKMNGMSQRLQENINIKIQVNRQTDTTTVVWFPPEQFANIIL